MTGGSRCWLAKRLSAAWFQVRGDACDASGCRLLTPVVGNNFPRCASTLSARSRGTSARAHDEAVTRACPPVDRPTVAQAEVKVEVRLRLSRACPAVAGPRNMAGRGRAKAGAGGGNRTHTPSDGNGILSPIFGCGTTARFPEIGEAGESPMTSEPPRASAGPVRRDGDDQPVQQFHHFTTLLWTIASAAYNGYAAIQFSSGTLRPIGRVVKRNRGPRHRTGMRTTSCMAGGPAESRPCRAGAEDASRPMRAERRRSPFPIRLGRDDVARHERG